MKKWKFEWCQLSEYKYKLFNVCVRFTLRYVTLKWNFLTIYQQTAAIENVYFFHSALKQKNATARKCCSQKMWVAFTFG